MQLAVVNASIDIFDLSYFQSTASISIPKCSSSIFLICHHYQRAYYVPDFFFFFPRGQTHERARPTYAPSIHSPSVDTFLIPQFERLSVSFSRERHDCSIGYTTLSFSCQSIAATNGDCDPSAELIPTCTTISHAVTIELCHTVIEALTSFLTSHKLFIFSDLLFPSGLRNNTNSTHSSKYQPNATSVSSLVRIASDTILVHRADILLDGNTILLF